jgi:large conductance mechanosensitive channel
MMTPAVPLSFPPLSKGSTMGMLKEFKEFAMKGNVVDMAIGVIIGTAFGKIVSSLVADMFMPMIGAITGKLDFSKMSYDVVNPLPPHEVFASIAYGKTITAIIDFVIVAFCLFLVIKLMNSMKRKEEVAPTVPPTKDQELLMEIRDILKQKG